MTRSKRRRLRSVIPVAAAIEICEPRQLLSGTDTLTILGRQAPVGDVKFVGVNLFYDEDAFLVGDTNSFLLQISVGLTYDSGSPRLSNNPGYMQYWIDDMTSGQNRVASGEFSELSGSVTDMSWLIEGHQYRIFARSTQRWSLPAYFGYISTSLRPLRDATTLSGAGFSVILPLKSTYDTNSDISRFGVLKGIRNYTIQITDRQTNRVVYSLTRGVNESVSLSDQLAGLVIPPGSYAAQIRSTIYTATEKNAQNSSSLAPGTTTETDWSDPINFVIGVPPVQITTGAGKTVDATPSIGWNPVPNAMSYEVWIGRAGSNQPVYWKPGITTIQHDVASALPIGEYQLWVRAKLYGGSMSLWGTARNLTIGARPVVASMTPRTLNWHYSVGATRYEVWIDYLGGASPARPKIVHETNVAGSPFTLPRNLPTGEFRYWIRAIRNEGDTVYRSAWSLPHSFNL